MTSWSDLGIEIPPGAHGDIKVRCPQCTPQRSAASQRKRDLSVNVEQGVWHCFHCEWKGSLGNFREDGTRTPRTEPVYQRPRPMPAQTAPTLWQNAVTWFAGRGISEQVMHDMHITIAKEFCPVCETETSHVLFPYFVDGVHTNTKHRCVRKHFRMESGAQRVLYNLDGVASETDVIVVEGEMDVLALKSAGVHNVISVPDGAPSPTAKNYASKFTFLEAAEDQLAKVQRFIIATDNDEPGQKLADELIRRLGPEKCSRVAWDDEIKDANECLMQAGAEYLRSCIDTATPVPVEGIVTPLDLEDALLRFHDGEGEQPVGLGSPAIDRRYRIMPGYLTIMTGHAGHGKALATDTPLATPSGWTTIGEIQPGEWVYDEKGRPQRVIAKGPVYHELAYRLTFSDGSEIIAHPNHEWLTRDVAAATSERAASRRGDAPTKLRGSDQKHKRTFPAVRTTAEIASTLRTVDGRANHAIAIASPLAMPDAHLPIPPYVMGAWLGDGTSDSAQITSADPQILQEIQESGWDVRETSVTKGNARLYGIGPRGSARTLLREAGVWRNKHIPIVYLRASERQRRDLLAGLMDTDGSITVYGRAEFCTTSPRLANDVHELVLGLGYKAVKIEDRARLNGQDIGPRWRVTWTPSESVFRLDRKAARCKNSTRDVNRYRYVVACDPIGEYPTQCIQVDGPSHLYLAGRALIPTHNSTMLDQFIMWLIEHHGWRFALFSPEQQPLHRHMSHLVSLKTGKPFHKQYHGALSRDEVRTANRELDEYVSFILPERPTIEAVLDRARIEVFRKGVKGIVLDPWNEFEHVRLPQESETEYVSRILAHIRRFARTYGVHIWLMAHPTKMATKENGQEPVPVLRDINGSVAFKNKADIGVTVWRDTTDSEPFTYVYVTKVRFIPDLGDIGAVKFRYEPANHRFTEIGDVS